MEAKSMYGSFNVSTHHPHSEPSGCTAMVHDPQAPDGGSVAVCAPGNTQCCGAVRFVSNRQFQIKMIRHLLQQYGKSISIFEQAHRLDIKTFMYDSNGAYVKDKWGDYVYTDLLKEVQTELDRINKARAKYVQLSLHKLDDHTFMVLIDATEDGGATGEWRNFQ